MRNLLPALAGLLLAAAAATAQETARDVLERAVKAHGGADVLTRHRADKVKLKGVLVYGAKEVAFTAETTVQLPGQFKNVLQLTIENRSVTLVQVLNGDAAHVTLDGQPQKIESGALVEMRETMHLARVVRLVPLLSDRGFELSLLPEAKVADRPVAVVLVRAKDRKEVRMYFDRETGLLVKTEHALAGAAGKEVRQEEYYADFRDLAGYKRPVKMTAYRDGKKVVEAELTEVKYFERLDDGEFAKP
jgi:negative regulator of sigma E activity